MLSVHTTTKRKSTCPTSAVSTLATNGNLNQQHQHQQPAQQLQAVNKRKRTKLAAQRIGNQQQRRQSGQHQQQHQQRLPSGTNISHVVSGRAATISNTNNNNNVQQQVTSGACGQVGQSPSSSTSTSSDESVWIFGLINNIEQLLTTFNAINSTSANAVSSSTTAAGATPPTLAARNGSGSSTPSNSSSCSLSSSALSSPQSSPAANGSCITTTAPVQHLTSAAAAAAAVAAAGAAAAAQTLPRSPMSRQIKFHEYKGPPSSKRQQQQQSAAQKQQTISISTNTIRTSMAPALQSQRQQGQSATAPKADIIVSCSPPKESVNNPIQKSSRISSPAAAAVPSTTTSKATSQQQQQQSSVSSMLMDQAAQAACSTKDRLSADFGISSHRQQQQQHNHQSLVNFHFSESPPATNGCCGRVVSQTGGDTVCQTNLMPVQQTQAHILHHPQLQHQQQKHQQQQQQLSLRQVRLTSGPQYIAIQQQQHQAPYTSNISNQRQAISSSDSLLVLGRDETAAVLASPSIETVRQNQQQQEQQTSCKIDSSEIYHHHNLHPQLYIQQQQQYVQQLHLQPFSSQLQAAPSTFMIHTTGHGSSDGSFVSRQLYSPIQATQTQHQQQQQNTLKIQLSPSSSMNSPATSGSTATANVLLRETANAEAQGEQAVQQQQQQKQSISPQQLQQPQEPQQQNISYRHSVNSSASTDAALELLGGGQQTPTNYCGTTTPQPLNQPGSDLTNDSGRSYMLDDADSLAAFGPDSEDIDACDIEPSIGFSHGSDELLFSEFIDLQDVPMNVDVSDWLKKFLPPCSMG